MPPSYRPPRPPRPATKKPSRKARGYDEPWQKVRLQVLNEEPLCRACPAAGRATWAECVDHIDGDVSNIDPMNLQALCTLCHSKKTLQNL